MDIIVHTTDGQSHSFFQEDLKKTAEILGRIQPTRLFNQKQIIIHGNIASSAFSTHSIEVIEFDTDMQPDWHAPGLAGERVFISRELFEAGLARLLRHFKHGVPEVKPGDEIQGYAQFTHTSGRESFVALRLVVKNKIEVLQMMQSFFDQGAIVAKRHEGGHVLINTDTITRAQLTPAPNATPANAWEATRKGEGLAERLSLEQIEKPEV